MITTLLHGPLPALAFLLTYAVHSTVLLLAVWLICRGLRGRALWLQDSLWKMALLGGIVTAIVQTGAGVQPLGGRIPIGAAPVIARVEVAQSEVRQELPTALVAGAAGRLAAAAQNTGATLLIEQTPLLRAGSSVPFGLSLGLLALGVAIALTLLGRRGWALWQLQGRLAGRTRVTEPELVAMVDELRSKGGLHRRVRLSCGPRLAVPLAMGLWRPEICLPRRALGELSREQQRVVLAHEMAHLVRRDPTWLLVCRVVESVLFFQPLNRLAGQRLQVLSEYLCDDWSVGLTGRLLVFARCLTEVAGWVVEEGPAMLPCMARPGSELSRRIGRLLEQQRSPWTTTRPRWLVPVLGGVLLAVAACAPRVCQVAVASPRPSFAEQPLDAAGRENQYLVAVADPAPNPTVVRSEHLRLSGSPSDAGKPGKITKNRSRSAPPPPPPVPPILPVPSASVEPAAPAAPAEPAMPSAPLSPRTPRMAFAPAPPAPPAAPRPPAMPAAPGFPAAPARPAAPAAPVAPGGAEELIDPEFARLAEEQAQLAKQMIPSAEQLARLSEKSVALDLAARRHDQPVQQRLQQELAELSAHLRPSPEALQQMRELSHKLAQKHQQLAQLDGLRAEHQQQALHDHLGEAAQRAEEAAARYRSMQSNQGNPEARAQLAAERARIEHEMAQVERDRARLERDQARLNEQLQRLNTEHHDREHEPPHDRPAGQP